MITYGNARIFELVSVPPQMGIGNDINPFEQMSAPLNRNNNE